ncbi:hypothetical protein PE066_03795 [Ramlibacter tataouinensis]|uniref:hypothetical protein n=1 Tax=Ramlibacter tataouinensis TaxID=94132 RepID=UPI0022F38AEE|nr:hypothetical protein [Ramlibacter tataouinensis]WBY02672.1 hypothetical protein PE066_03795 [Ramlibacter tataouinensis]
MYAPPADRTSPLSAQLERLQAERAGAAPTPFERQLAAARHELSHYSLAPTSVGARAASGLTRRSRLQPGG